MKNDEKFESFYIKIPETPNIKTAEAKKSEAQLLNNFRLKGARAETLKPLIIFYSQVSQYNTAYHYLKIWFKCAENKEEMAECFLISGQLAEQVNQFKAAISFYYAGLKQKINNIKINYFLCNNLAYCLNIQKDYITAKKYCEAAISLDSNKVNAFKNLGLSFRGLKQYGEAAKAWIKAIHIDASDGRALELLEELFIDNSEKLKTEISDIVEQLKACKRAVALAQRGRFADWSQGVILN